MTRPPEIRAVRWVGGAAAVSVAIAVAACVPRLPSGADPGPVRARNVIFLVGDGLGVAGVTAARLYRHGAQGPRLALESLERIGYIRTEAANSIITDSAAAASAWSCGELFRNGEICLHAQDGRRPESLFEIAHRRGMLTGLVATSSITHATPAAFAAHVASRSCETEIAREMVEVARVDVILGGGGKRFRTDRPDSCGTEGDFIAAAKEHGYRVVFDRDGLSGARGALPLLGLFAADGMTPVHRRREETTEPTLVEMAQAALASLERGDNGFIAMIEASQIDWGCHESDAEYMIRETLEFDDTVAAVLRWVDAEPGRRESTLVIVLSDHEAGGLSILGPASRRVKPGSSLQTNFATMDHTASDVLIWSGGPGAERLARPLDHPDVFSVVRDLLR